MPTRRTALIVLLMSCALALAREAHAQLPPTPPADPGQPGETPRPDDASPRPTPEEPPLAPAEPLAPPAPPAPRAAEPSVAATSELPAPRFGAPGELVITGAAAIGISSTSFSRSQASRFAAVFSPGFDVFVIRNVSVGGDLDIAYERVKGYGSNSTGETTTVAGGPRIGLNVPLGDLLSWYPRLTVGFASVGSVNIDMGASRATPFVSVFAPLLLHPKPHVFFGFGPAARREFGALDSGGTDAQRTTVAGRFVVGAWWGGHADGVAPPDATTQVVATRFGERGQWVFTGEAGGALSWTVDHGGDRSITVASFTPAIDYFVARHFSIGLAGSGYYAHASYKGGDPTNTTSFGLGPRVGVDVPLARGLSLYPRANIFFSHEATDRTSGLALSTVSDTVVALGIYAPLLVHVATHAFVGFGPYLAQDVSRTGNNVATRVGAALVVGGWL